MVTTIRFPDVDNNGNFIMKTARDSTITVPGPCIMAIDGSTTNTGVAILRKNDGALYFSIAATREKGETPVQYKVRLKRFIEGIIKSNTMLDVIYYEEPFIGYAEAAKSLLMLRTFVEEIIVENEPSLDYIKHSEINNMKWKRLFLAPDKCPPGTELQKAAVRKRLESYMPYLSVVTQDEIDAISMGFVATVKMREGLDEELESKKKIHAFQYNVEFVGSDTDDDVLNRIPEYYHGPEKLLSNGILLTEMGKREDFDKHIYMNMGQDDKLLIVRFSSDSHGNIILKHKLGNLSNIYSYLYAFVWRKARKV